MGLLYDILLIILDVAWWAIIIQFVMSWLLVFNVIKLNNDFVANVWETLRRITDPLYNPIRKILPNFGQLDLSPMVVLFLISILRNTVIPSLFASLLAGA